jgi:DNA-binding XRE family transcriptional regulator
MELGLFQRDVAKRLGIGVFTYLTWEKERKVPFNRYWPKIVDFLGSDPSPAPQALGERIKAKRRELGLTQRGLAQLLGWDPGTIYRYELGVWAPSGDRLVRMEAWLGARPAVVGP